MKEIDANKDAWSKISEDHYRHFKETFSEGIGELNSYIKEELGYVSGKNIIHLQCNTGGDTIILAKTAKSVTGVDFVPENIYFAKKLAVELGIEKQTLLNPTLWN